MPVNEQPAGDFEVREKARWGGVLERVKNEGMEGLFYCTLIIAVVEGGLILWDLLTMMPWFARVAGLSGANTYVASAEMSNIYLGFLTAYCGGKEAKRWLERPGAASGEQADGFAAQVQRFSRGMTIVFGWQALLVMAVVIKDLHLVRRMPDELFRVAMQSLALWTGTYVSGKAYSGRMKQKRQNAAGETVAVEVRQEDAPAESAEPERGGRISDAHRELVLDYLKTARWISSEKCREMTGLKPAQVNRLFTSLVEQGYIIGEGSCRGRRYRIKEANDAPLQ